MIKPALILASAVLGLFPQTASAPTALGLKPQAQFSPMSLLPPASRQTFACIMWRESRSTPAKLNATDLNPSSWAGGIFQFTPLTWRYYAQQIGVTALYAQTASVIDQFRVASRYYLVNGGFRAWSSDGC